MTTYTIDFHNRLTKLRKKHNLTLDKVAKDIDVSNQAISFLEKGRRLPSFDVLTKLAMYFDVSLDYLVGFSDEPRKNESVYNILSIDKRKLIDMISTLSDEDIQALIPIVSRMIKG